MGFTPLLHDYFQNQQRYEKVYGSKTVVLYQVGSFYEVYQTEIPKPIGKTKEISDLLHIQITKKNKAKPHNEANPYMLGFPLHAVQKFIKRLINNHYTVVKFDQKDIKDSAKKDRVLDKIYSVSTYIENETPLTNNLVCIIQNTDGYLLSCVDLSTGSCQVYETFSTKEMVNRAENEAYRFVHGLNPTEILVFDNNNGKDIIKNLQLNSDMVHYRTLEKEYHNIHYQNQFLDKVYSCTKQISQIENINLERYPDSVACFIFLLQFAYEHDPSIISRLQKPIIHHPDDTLILNRDTFNQLNIFGTNNKKTGSVFNLVNFCKTNMGRRLLKDRLLNPIVSINELTNRYDNVDYYTNIHVEIHSILDQICDFDKKHRKAVLGKISPNELYGLLLSYELVSTLIERECPDNMKLGKNTLTNYNSFVQKLKHTFIQDKLQNLFRIDDIKFSIFPKGAFPEIDNLDNQINALYNTIETERVKYNNIISRTQSCIKLVFNETDGHYFQTTTLRYKVLEKSGVNIEGKSIKNIAKFSNSIVRECSTACRQKEKEMIELVLKTYKKKIVHIYKLYGPTLYKVSQFIAKLDLFCSSAKCAIQYNYHRPTLIQRDSSAVEMTGCRHPLIERLIDTEYISNDIVLGENERGILLYGINSSGKSSLLKSIGCNIVLAQAGLFVPCAEMKLTPFRTIYSKILSDDDLFKGQSTFVKEMSQLRDILQGAGTHSLVLADELCSGTESLSATAILASTLATLEKENACYVFSTHLHDLPTIPLVKNLQQLAIYHFNVKIENEQVVYDRTLSKGSGDTMYGLEIAKSMNIDSEFIRNAFRIRENLSQRSGEILQTKKSKYNAKKFVHACEKCGKEGEGLHTHHIQPQKLADEKGMIGNIHKNILSNLMVLCEECHKVEHEYKN